MTTSGKKDRPAKEVTIGADGSPSDNADVGTRSPSLHNRPCSRISSDVATDRGSPLLLPPVMVPERRVQRVRHDCAHRLWPLGTEFRGTR